MTTVQYLMEEFGFKSLADLSAGNLRQWLRQIGEETVASVDAGHEPYMNACTLYLIFNALLKRIEALESARDGLDG